MQGQACPAVKQGSSAGHSPSNCSQQECTEQKLAGTPEAYSACRQTCHGSACQGCYCREVRQAHSSDIAMFDACETSLHHKLAAYHSLSSSFSKHAGSASVPVFNNTCMLLDTQQSTDSRHRLSCIYQRQRSCAVFSTLQQRVLCLLSAELQSLVLTATRSLMLFACHFNKAA